MVGNLTRAPSDRRAGLRTRRSWLAIGLLGLACGCSKDSGGGSPAAPGGAQGTIPPPAPTTFTISGDLTATNDGRPLTSATVTIGAASTATGGQGLSTTTDGSGRYSLTLPAAGGLLPFSVQGGGVLMRTGFVTAGSSRSVNLDAIVQDSSFDLTFFRQLVRGHFDGLQRPLLRWVANPNVYLQTVDNTSGRAVEPEVLSLVTDWIQRSITSWSSHRFRVGTFETGTAARPDATGWIIVDFVRDPNANFCGRALVGGNPGHVTLNNDRCNCGSVKVPAGTVLHEFGHAMGFYHVNDRSSIMYPQDPGGCPNPALSAAEQRHSAIAYQRPLLNQDPDDDPPNTPLVARPVAMSLP